jgi:hypothetical protein
MDKKIITATAVLLVLIVGIVSYLTFGKGMPQQSTTDSNVSTFIGALVNEGSTTLTLSKSDGTKKTFELSGQVPVYSQAASGEKGKLFWQLSAGDILSVTATDPGNVAKRIEVVPMSEADWANGTQVITGTVDQLLVTSITVTLPKDPLPGIPEKKLKVLVLNDTAVLTETLGDETGKPYADIRPGDRVRIFLDLKETTPTAKVIEILRTR